MQDLQPISIPLDLEVYVENEVSEGSEEIESDLSVDCAAMTPPAKTSRV